MKAVLTVVVAIAPFALMAWDNVAARVIAGLWLGFIALGILFETTKPSQRSRHTG